MKAVFPVAAMAANLLVNLIPSVSGRIVHRKLAQAGDTETRIPGEYICVSSYSSGNSYQNATDAGGGDWDGWNSHDITNLVEARGGAVTRRYDSVFRGMAVSGVTDQALEELLNRNDVEVCEENRWGNYDGWQNDPKSWGLDRIDQQDWPLDGEYRFAGYGTGVRVYILDSGIRASHEDFANRVVCIFDPTGGRDCRDEFGHGTHVAGTAVGRTSGVAKNAQVFAAKVGSTAGPVLDWTIDAVEAAVRHHSSTGGGGGGGGKKGDTARTSVLNLSVGFSLSPTLQRAVENAANAGILTVTSAGNNGGNACQQSPASSNAVLSVASVQRGRDERSSYSNYGSCVDIFAPGDDIVSASIRGTSSYTTLSGTSMATPHVTGAAAIVLENNPGMTVRQVKDEILRTAITGKIRNAGSGSPNRLVCTIGSKEGNKCSQKGFCLTNKDCCGKLLCHVKLMQSRPDVRQCKEKK